jgi:hypothetical protein
MALIGMTAHGQRSGGHVQRVLAGILSFVKSRSKILER